MVASLTGALAVLTIVGWGVPSLVAHRAATARLRAFLDEPTDRIQHAGFVTRRRGFAIARPAWLIGREWWLVLVAAPVAVQVITSRPVLTIATILQVLMFSSLLGQHLTAARTKMLNDQTLPTVLRLAAVIRAGGSLSQAIQTVANDAPSPTREEFQRVVDEVTLGSSLDDALERLGQRMGTDDYVIMSQVLSILRRVGGNLPRVLDQIADTVRDRIAIRQEVATLTAQQRLSTWVLALLPYGILALFFVADRSFLRPFVDTDTGGWLLLAAAGLQTMGSWALRVAGRIPT